MLLRGKLVSFILVLALLISTFGMLSYAVTRTADGEERAAQFISAVDSIEDIADIVEKYEAIEIAYSDLIYFDDVSYAGVAEALQKLDELRISTEGTIDKCEEFIGMVDELIYAYDELGYSETKTALLEIADLLPFINYTYPAVSDAKASHDSIKHEIDKGEKFTAEFIREVEKLNSCTTYAEKKAISYNLNNYMNSKDFIAEYEGVDEALVKIQALDAYFTALLRDATLFKMAADDAAAASPKEFKKKLIACFSHLDKVDMTVDAAIDARDTFDKLLGEYKNTAQTANSIMQD